jgi:hypothetical protein
VYSECMRWLMLWLVMTPHGISMKNAWNISDSKKNSARHDPKKWSRIFTWSTRYSCPILIQRGSHLVNMTALSIYASSPSCSLPVVLVVSRETWKHIHNNMLLCCSIQISNIIYLPSPQLLVCLIQAHWFLSEERFECNADYLFNGGATSRQS